MKKNNTILNLIPILLMLLCSINMNITWAYEEFDTFYKTLYVNQKIDLSDMAYGKIGIEDVSWFSNNPKVATVDAKGIVTAKDNGRAVIQATPTNGSSLPHFSFAITVRTGLRSLELSVPKQNLYVGEKTQVSWTANGPNITSSSHDNVTIKSSNPSILTIDKNGEITARKEGHAFVTIVSNDLSARDLLEFSVRSMVKRIFVEDVPETIAVGETVKAHAYVYPDDAFVKTLKWDSSSNVQVTNTGYITGISEGVAYVKAISDDGEKTDTKKLNVYSLVRDVQVSEEQIALKIGETHRLKAKIIPKLKSRPPFWNDVIWKSDKPKVASISSDGTVTGISSGYATITATTKDGNKVDQCIVKVIGSKTIDTIILFTDEAKNIGTSYVDETVKLPFNVLKSGVTKEPIIHVYGGKHTYYIQDNAIYFTAQEIGDYAIISGEGKDTDKVAIHCISKIQAININTKNLDEYRANRYRFYNGQQGYLYGDVIPRTDENIKKLIWESSDGSVFSIDSSGQYKANRVGESVVTLKTSDLAHTKNIYVEVVPLTESISTATSVKMGTFIDYEPEVIFMIPQSLKNKFEYVQNDNYTLKVESLYIPRTYLKDEINYEIARRKEWINYKKNKYDKEKNLDSLIKNSRNRESIFHSWIVNNNDDFCLVDNNEPLLNRNYVTVQPIVINGKKLFGNMPCEAQIKLTSEDGGHILHFDIKIDPTLKDEILVYQDNKWSSFYEKSKEKQSKRYTSKDNINIGKNKKAISLKDRASRYNIVLPLEISKLQYDLTRKDMVDISIKFISYFNANLVPNTNSNIFLDTDLKSANQAFQLGLISLNADRKFSPNKKVSREEMAGMLYKCLQLTSKNPIPDNNKTKSYNDLDMVQNKNKEAIILLALQNEFITSSSPNLLRPKEIVSLEEGILTTMNLLDNISYYEETKK